MRAQRVRRASAAAPCRCEAAAAAAEISSAPSTSADYRQRDPKDVRVLVVGATGYIGKFVVRELVNRGYDVVALARERSGVGGKATRDDVQRVRAGSRKSGSATCWQCLGFVLGFRLCIRCAPGDRKSGRAAWRQF